MQMDSYVEFAVVAKPKMSLYFKIMLSLVIAVIGVIVAFFVYFLIGLVIFVLGVYFCAMLAGEMKVEYEYTFTNGSVDIDAIYNASRRKDIKKFELEQVKMVVPKNSKRIEHESFRKKYDFSSSDSETENHVVSLVLDYNGKKDLIHLELNDKCLNHLKMYVKDRFYED